MESREATLRKLYERIPKHVREPDARLYEKEDYVTLDFETTNLDKGDPYNPDNRIVLGAWRTGEGSEIHVEVGNEFNLPRLCAAVEAASFIVAHNAKFELGWLQRAGVDISRIPVYCTQIGEFVLAGNRKLPLGLDACLKRRGLLGKASVVGTLIKNGVCPSKIPESWLSEYCVVDVRQTWKLFLLQRECLMRMSKLPLVYTKCLLTPVLVHLEKEGMFLDSQKVTSYHAVAVHAADELQIEFDEFTGGINTNSPKQKAEYMYETLGFKVPRDYRGKPMVSAKSELPMTNADAFQALKPTNKKQKRFIELYKELNHHKQYIQKYLSSLLACCAEAGGTLLGSIGQTFTSTQRSQSNGKRFSIQLQNIPRSYKQLFTTRRKGWAHAERDYSSLEFKVAAHLGADARALNDLAEGFDPHAFSASELFVTEWAAVGGLHEDDKRRKAVRTQAKADTFKPLFGGTSGTKSQQKYYKAFRERYPGITGTQERWKAEVIRTGRLKLPTGLDFFWPGTYMQASGYVTNTTKICNYPIQYFAFEIVMIGVIYLFHLIQAAKMQSILINIVHDSAVAEVHPDELELYDLISKEAMENEVPRYLTTMYGIDMMTTLETDLTLGTHWGETNYAT